jgi:hypothetical protein
MLSRGGGLDATLEVPGGPDASFASRSPEPAVVEELRRRHHIEQITPLRDGR